VADNKVAIVGYYHGPRLGVGVYIDRLMSHLKLESENGTQITFYTNKNTLAGIKSLSPDVKVVNSFWLNAGSIPAIFFTAIVFPLICYFQKVKVAVLLSNPIVLFRFAQTVSVIHDLNEFEVDSKYGVLRTYYRKKIMLKSALRNSSTLIAISRFVASQIATFFPEVPEERINVIESGVEIQTVSNEQVDSVLRKHGLSYHGYFLVVGRIDPHGKSLYEAVKLFRYLITYREDCPDKLLFVGGINKSSREEANKFLKFIKNDLELSTRVIYLGYVNNITLASLYRGAMAVIFLSRNEGFGFPLIEAFGHGCPVIYNPACKVLHEHAEGAGIAITDEMLRNGSFDSARFESLYDPKSREELSVRMKTIASKYDWDRCALGYLDLFNRTASRNHD